MRVLITGGAGMVGSHTAEYYALRQEEVIVLDNLMRSKLFGYDKKSVEYNWNYLKKYKNIKRIRGDVRDKRDVCSAIGGGVELCVHAAGQPGVGLSVKEPMEDFSINACGTLNVLECLRQKSRDACFIYCSTNKVFGENVDRIKLIEKEKRYLFESASGVKEDMPIDLTGHTPYGASKYTGDIYAQEYAHIYGMKTGVFRMSCTYGVRQFGFEDQGWIAHFIISNLLRRPVTIYGDGKQVRDILYVEDLVAAYDKFFKSPIKHNVYNIGGGTENTASLLELIDAIEKETGIKMEYKFGPWRSSDQKVYISDISKISKELDWRPKITLPYGVKLLTNWARDNIKVFG
ncbi:MAG: GDP-mannose 4,6-dehydratase [Candidatus Omnitrophota bacterium]|nr:GDP-mannose 4,6-dehydratase [Candidatus Omnitrophota bacterium]